MNQIYQRNYYRQACLNNDTRTNFVYFILDKRIDNYVQTWEYSENIFAEGLYKKGLVL